MGQNNNGYFDPDAGYGGQAFGIPDLAPPDQRTKAVRFEYYAYERAQKLVSTALFRVGQHCLFPSASKVLEGYVNRWVSETLHDRFYYVDDFGAGHSLGVDLNGHASAMVSYQLPWQDLRTQVQNRQTKAIPFDLIAAANKQPGRLAYRRKDRHVVFAEAFRLDRDDPESEIEMVVGIFPDYLHQGGRKGRKPVMRDDKVVLERPGCLIWLVNTTRLVGDEEEITSFVDLLAFYEGEIGNKFARPVLEAMAGIRPLDQKRPNRGPNTRYEADEADEPSTATTAPTTETKSNGFKVSLGDQLKNKGLKVPTIGNGASTSDGDSDDEMDEEGSSSSEMS